MRPRRIHSAKGAFTLSIDQRGDETVAFGEIACARGGFEVCGGCGERNGGEIGGCTLNFVGGATQFFELVKPNGHSDFVDMTG